MNQGPILPADRQNDIEWGVEVLIFLVVWILLNYVVLPKLGVPT